MNGFHFFIYNETKLGSWYLNISTRYVCNAQSVYHIIYCLGDDEEEGYFGQEQVPLTDEIREILEEYPDGQIFKVSKQTSMMSVQEVHLIMLCGDTIVQFL